jgi:hypothetical protein
MAHRLSAAIMGIFVFKHSRDFLKACSPFFLTLRSRQDALWPNLNPGKPPLSACLLSVPSGELEKSVPGRRFLSAG